MSHSLRICFPFDLHRASTFLITDRNLRSLPACHPIPGPVRLEPAGLAYGGPEPFLFIGVGLCSAFLFGY